MSFTLTYKLSTGSNPTFSELDFTLNCNKINKIKAHSMAAANPD